MMVDETKTEKSWLILIILSLSAFIIAIDSTFMNVAISALVVDLNTQLSVIQGIIAVGSVHCFR